MQTTLTAIYVGNSVLPLIGQLRCIISDATRAHGTVDPEDLAEAIAHEPADSTDFGPVAEKLGLPREQVVSAIHAMAQHQDNLIVLNSALEARGLPRTA